MIVIGVIIGMLEGGLSLKVGHIFSIDKSIV